MKMGRCGPFFFFISRQHRCNPAGRHAQWFAAPAQSLPHQGDLLCRMGGEEFVIICLDLDDDGALQLAERMRTAIEHSKVFAKGMSAPIRCTVTIGVLHAFNTMQGFEPCICLPQADAALYHGKKAGRNPVERMSDKKDCNLALAPWHQNRN